MPAGRSTTRRRSRPRPPDIAAEHPGAPRHEARGVDRPAPTQGRPSSSGAAPRSAPTRWATLPRDQRPRPGEQHGFLRGHDRGRSGLRPSSRTSRPLAHVDPKGDPGRYLRHSAGVRLRPAASPPSASKAPRGSHRRARPSASALANCPADPPAATSVTEVVSSTTGLYAELVGSGASRSHDWSPDCDATSRFRPSSPAKATPFTDPPASSARGRSCPWSANCRRARCRRRRRRRAADRRG